MSRDEPISRMSRSRFRTLLEGEKIVLTILMVLLTAVIGWMVKLQLDTLYAVTEIKSTINRHSEQLSMQDRRISVQETNGTMIAVINDRMKMQEERFKQHTTAILTAEDILHEIEKRLSLVEVGVATNEANHVSIERRLDQVLVAIETHASGKKK